MKGGEGVDIDAWVRAYGDALLRLCLLYLKDYHLAEDAVQETFLRAYRGYGGFRGECSAQTWLSGIAANVCKSMLRTAWFRRVDRRRRPDELPGRNATAAPSDDGLVRAIQDLPLKYREVVLLHYYRGLKLREIAQALGVKPSAVSMRLSRARDMLRSELEGSDEHGQ